MQKIANAYDLITTALEWGKGTDVKVDLRRLWVDRKKRSCDRMDSCAAAWVGTPREASLA